MKRTGTKPKRIAVFASGSGTNLAAIIDHFAQPRAAAVGTVALVASDNRTAGALARAAGVGIAAAVFGDPSDGVGIHDLLASHQIDFVALAGYLKLVPEGVVSQYAGRILNVHPALLPAFGGHGMYGVRVHKAVIASGARVSGPTVHFVGTEYDRGPIIMQWPVPVYATDTAASLGARVLQVEHILYPRVLEAIAAGAIDLTEEGVQRTTAPQGKDSFVFGDSNSITAAIDAAVLIPDP